MKSFAHLSIIAVVLMSILATILVPIVECRPNPGVVIGQNQRTETVRPVTYATEITTRWIDGIRGQTTRIVN